MISWLGQMQEIAVQRDGSGMPASLVYKGQSRKVAKVYEHWRIADGWWGDEVRRDYFRIETAQGVSDIYHDTLTDRWYLTKGHG